MTFLKWSMLCGLVAVTIPILLHLLNQRQVRATLWGAMHFLFGSVQRRRRRVLLEEMLVLVLRCLILALVAVAMARPVAPPGGGVAWGITVLAVLIAAMCAAAATALRDFPRWRWGLAAAAVLLAAYALSAPVLSGRLRSGPVLGAAPRDIAIIMDGSGSMSLRKEGKTSFDRAIEEARGAIGLLRQGDAAGIVLAGATARRVTPAPVYEREQLPAMLDKLSPSAGPLDMPGAFEAAATLLEGGENQLKQILVFTDGQTSGWQPENAARWREVSQRLWRLSPDAKPVEGHPAPMRVITVVVPPPKEVRNLTLVDVAPARALVSRDRPVDIRATVRNTGRQTAGPARVTLRVNKDELMESAIGLIEPGQTASATFVRQFASGGTHMLLARLEFEDDLPGDNVCGLVLSVPEAIPVLVIEGSPAPRPLDRAAAFVLAALNPPPASAAARTAPTPGQAAPVSGKAPSVPEKPSSAGLFRPTVLPISELARAGDLKAYRLIILADVPRLPSPFAEQTAAYVNNGGNLIVIAGDRTEPSFYNAWLHATGQHVTGVQLGERRILNPPAEPAHLELSTLSHPALARLSDPRTSDLNLAAITAYWRLNRHTGLAGTDVRTAAAFNTGDPLLMETRAGRGRVLTFAAALDRSAGNLPLRRSFVPLILSLAYDMVGSDEPSLVNQTSDVALQLRLPVQEMASPAGLQAKYFSDTEFRSFVGERVEPQINAAWGQNSPLPGMPRDKFSVRWSGMLTPLVSGPHTFYLAANGEAGIRLNGAAVIRRAAGGGYASTTLTAGKPVDFQCDFVRIPGQSSIRLEWEALGSGLTRQVIPADRFQALRTLEGALSGVEGTADAPDGRRLPVRIAPSGNAFDLLGEFATAPGLYRIALPAGAAERVPEFWRGEFPVAVRPTAGETPVEPLTSVEQELLSRSINLYLPRSPEDLAAAMAGDIVGREFGEYLLLAAVLAALLEVALTRWIAVQRGTATARAPEFQETVGRIRLSTPAVRAGEGGA